MARCSDCNKFVSTEIGEIEIEDAEIDSGELHLTVSITKNCAECGNPLTTGRLEVTKKIELTADALPPMEIGDIDHTLEAIVDEKARKHPIHLEGDATLWVSFPLVITFSSEDGHIDASDFEEA